MLGVRVLVGVVAVAALAACSGSNSPSGGRVDATHQPPPISSGTEAAPADLAAALLTPTDLGSAWSAVETPAVGITTPPPIEVGPKPAYMVSTNLQAQHWNGSTWTQDQNLQESATSYGTPAKATRWLSLAILQGRGQCTQCPFVYRPVTVDGTKVWRYDNRTVGSAQALFAVGPLFVRMTISAPAGTEPDVVAADTAIRLAVQRLRQPASPA